MPARRLHKITLEEIGSVLEMTRAGVAHHAAKYGRDVVADPEKLFAALLLTSNASRLRDRLRDRGFRAAAAKQLKALAQ